MKRKTEAGSEVFWEIFLEENKILNITNKKDRKLIPVF